ncbi:hypothetical protein BZA05DRAFT_421026 [Tricharina praecox]|uniref:uncharacterized protein n=1 Tax=Tricharina praecox TaxID=43433 RepID=UPI0022208D89|nr:uncharacterized protein BZA05DRAFT_421026 [Tricharina praecox]KAI5846075.1 hypothetical protein BZA05DRAFT_421026 [Tricharina praecox]
MTSTPQPTISDDLLIRRQQPPRPKRSCPYLSVQAPTEPTRVAPSASITSGTPTSASGTLDQYLVGEHFEAHIQKPMETVCSICIMAKGKPMRYRMRAPHGRHRCARTHGRHADEISDARAMERQSERYDLLGTDRERSAIGSGLMRLTRTPALAENSTWDYVQPEDSPASVIPISSKWVFKTKELHGAPRLWYQHIDEFLRSLGHCRYEYYDPNVYISFQDDAPPIILLPYDDDIGCFLRIEIE